jgi:polyribonucleotide nucleotidyltransferase
VVKKGDRVRVKLIERDERGRLRLSKKALEEKPESMSEENGGGERVERAPRREERDTAEAAVGAESADAGERSASERPSGERPSGSRGRGGRGGRGGGRGRE